MVPKIIFQDDFFLVMDKPAGWITNEADTTTNQPVVQTWLKKNLTYPISNIQYLRSGVVHRLDKETSGLLLVAKTENAFTELQNQFKQRVVKKTYTALVHGNVKPQKGNIKLTVGRLPWRRDRFGTVPDGRESETDYKVIGWYELEGSKKPHLKNYSLVEFYPKTGRTHQIRIHAKYIGHPLVSDEFYAGRKTVREDRKWCPRLFLHASGISFRHPQKGERLEFASKLPEDLNLGISKLTLIKNW